MAVLTVNTIDRAGNGLADANTAAGAGGDSFANSGREFVLVFNGSGSPITITAPTPQTVVGLAVADETYTIPAGARHFIGPFPPGTFNDANGRVNFTYSGVTSLTVGAYKVG